MGFRAALMLASLAALPALRAEAGWQSLGPLPAARATAHGLQYRDGRVSLDVLAVAEGVARVRFVPRSEPGPDRSWALVEPRPSPPGARITREGRNDVLSAGGLRVVVRRDTGRLEVQAADGTSLDADDPERGIAWAGPEVRVTKRLRDDEHVYGLGEKTGPLDKRGWQLGGSSVAMWNSDTYRYDQSTDPLYVSVPFYLVLRQGRAHGLFLDNSHRSSFDVGRSSRSRLSFGAEGGELDYYVIDGPSPRRVLERYTALTGRVPLPPLWALGYHQSRYSYFPDSRLRELAREFRERRIPADVLWLDIHALQGFRPFTWDRGRFPDPARLLADLRAQGLRTVVIVDPHPKKQPGDPVYDAGLVGDHFVRLADGSVFEGQVWPARAPADPGPSVFPDFSRAATRAWWGGLYRSLLDLGVAGIWNDMNEPSVFDGPAGTLPLDARHDGDGRPTDHAEIHNVYGQLMARSTFEGLLRLRPDQRPFVLTRASFAGGQRFAAVWPGDSSSDWSHLRGSIPMLLGLGLSGFAFAGADVGGFSDDASPELLARWLQLGAFFPFFRNHSDFGTADQEPWVHGQPWEQLNRRAIELRYELLPYLYTALREASRTGVPAMRPLFLDFPQDEATWRLDDEFLFGSDLLAAPVVREGQRQREVYLPAGAWHDFWTGARLEGGRRVNVDAPLERLPLFVRAGAFVFRQPVVSHTGEMPGQPLIVDVYPAARSEGLLYEDDGQSLAYQQGAFAERVFHQARGPEGCRLSVEAPRGSWRPGTRARWWSASTPVCCSSSSIWRRNSQSAGGP
jgi:alpha-glucosidase